MLGIRTILHPTDFSLPSRFAFQLACSLARSYGARLVVLHVTEPPIALSGEGVPMLPPEVDPGPLRKKLNEHVSDDPRVRVERRLEKGDAADTILQVAEQTNADLIVMGTRGRTGVIRLLMGSVAEKVVRRASCPVLTIKIEAPKPNTQTASAPEMVGSTAVPANG